jgi:hypothetical protein
MQASFCFAFCAIQRPVWTVPVATGTVHSDVSGGAWVHCNMMQLQCGTVPMLQQKSIQLQCTCRYLTHVHFSCVLIKPKPCAHTQKFAAYAPQDEMDLHLAAFRWLFSLILAQLNFLLSIFLWLPDWSCFAAPLSLHVLSPAELAMQMS